MKTQDLTKGSITQHFLRLAAPLLFGNILQQFYNTIDALVIGRCSGQLEFAAVGVASSVMNLFMFAIVGACTGISVLFAQEYGARDLKTFRQQHFLTIAAGIPVVTVFCLIGIFLLPAVLHLIQTPSSLAPFVKNYLVIVLAGLPATYLYNLYSAILRAVGHITLRVILSWMFVGRFGLDAVAVATGIGWILVNLFWSVLYGRKGIANEEH